MREEDKFDIILSDFPWKYEVYDEATGSNRAATQHYETSDPSAFYDLPISDLMKRNSLLCMWVPSPNFPQLEELINAWNLQPKYKYQRYKYKTIIHAWIKLNPKWVQRSENILKSGVNASTLQLLIESLPFKGLGKYTRSNLEVMVLYGRGSLSQGVERCDAGVPQVVLHPRMEHSRKPDIFHELISRQFPKAKCLEMFARRIYPDKRWTCIGNEISNRDIHTDIEALQNGSYGEFEF